MARLICPISFKVISQLETKCLKFLGINTILGFRNVGNLKIHCNPLFLYSLKLVKTKTIIVAS